MTESAALHPPHLVCVTAAIMFLAAWIATHALHDRRLKRFANPQLLGFAGMWPRRICSGVLLAGATGALAALLAIAGDRSPVPGKGLGAVLFLVDPPERSPGMPYLEGAWGDYSRDLRCAVESVEPELISFYLTGSVPRLVVPYTEDVPGALLLLEAGSFDFEASSASVVEASVGAIRLISSGATAAAASTVIVFSSKAEPEIDAIANSLQGGPPVIFVRSAPGRGEPGYRREGPGAQWMRLDDPESLRSFAMNVGHAGERRGWQDTQVLALAAFLLLYLEWSFRLSRPAGRVAGRRVAPLPYLHGNAGGGGSGPGVLRCLPVMMICLVARQALPSESGDPGRASHRVSVEAIGPHAAIVTEISDEEPCVGQQFSVIYRLRCSIPPVAVDVDPQDFAGFWSVTAPTTGQARPESVTLNGKAATDFLLRQVIVFPLKPGKQVLPSLRLKIKQDVSSRDDWDLTRQTGPVVINVKPVSVAGEREDAFFMVGSLEAAVSGGDSGSAHEAVLAVEGTANLDFFRPERLLKGRDGQPLLVRLRDVESLVQTRDYEGRRRLTLLQRRRWVVSAPAGDTTDVAVNSLSIPVFDPEASRWRSVRIPAFGFGPGDSRAAQVPHPSAGSPQLQRGIGVRCMTPGTVAFGVSCLALLVVVISSRRKPNA